MNQYNIKQLALEIKVLKIGKKQCTISVFKQIKDVEINFDEDFSLWGEVFATCLGRTCWWIVYSQNNLIFKCPKSDTRRLAVKMKMKKFANSLQNLEQLFIAV